MLLIYSQTVSAIATATCDLRAAALLLFEAVTLPPRWDLEEVSLTWAGVTMSNTEQAQRKHFLGLDMCWLQKHNSGPILVETVDQSWSKQWTNPGRNSHTEVQSWYTRRQRLIYTPCSTLPRLWLSAEAAEGNLARHTAGALYPQQGCGHVEP